jgi:hypothetical protein
MTSQVLTAGCYHNNFIFWLTSERAPSCVSCSFHLVAQDGCIMRGRLVLSFTENIEFHIDTDAWSRSSEARSKVWSHPLLLDFDKRIAKSGYEFQIARQRDDTVTWIMLPSINRHPVYWHLMNNVRNVTKLFYVCIPFGRSFAWRLTATT